MKTEVIIDGKVKKMSSVIARILVKNGRAMAVEDSEELQRKQEAERIAAEAKAKKDEEKRLLKEQKEAEKKAKKEAEKQAKAKK